MSSRARTPFPIGDQQSKSEHFKRQDKFKISQSRATVRWRTFFTWRGLREIFKVGPFNGATSAT